jgi:hypothetical protein
MEKAPSLITMVDGAVSDRAIFDHSVCAGLVLVSRYCINYYYIIFRTIGRLYTLHVRKGMQMSLLL